MKKLFSTVIISLLAFTGAQAQLSTNPDKFLGNITTSGQVDFGNEKFYQLWNQITPENETKWDAIEPSRGNFTFGGADRSANYAKQHNFPFKYHTFIWGAQYPKWMDNLSTADQYKAIVEYFDAVKAHYPNLEVIDVVNEAINGHQPAPYRAALGGEGRTGFDWIIKAFQLAHERWPNAILVYNDYNTFQWQKNEFINLVRTLRDAGAPIDAYGCQSHDITDMSLSTFKSAMSEIQNALKIPMYSTEFDIGTADDQKQLTQYKNLIPVLWEADYCAGITLWGYIYGRTWTTDGNSGLIRDGKDRPAMTWLRQYMQSDKAKTAKSPFPGFKKEASLYVKPASMKVAKGDKLPVWVDATLATKTIEKVELYNGTTLIATMTEAPYIAEFSSTTTGTKTLKAVVTATDGSTFERLSRVQVLSSATPRTPYNDVVAELPGVVEAMNYDNGVDGVAFSNAERTGATKTGGWMEYTVDVKETGLYSVDIEVAAAQNGGMFHLVDNHFGDMVFLSDFATVPSTGGSTEYKTIHLRLNNPLEAGRHTLSLCIDKGGFSIGKMTFTPLEVNNGIRTSIKVTPTTINVGETASIITTAVLSAGIANVKVFVNDMLLTTLTEKPYIAEFTPTVQGTYSIAAIATDVNGKESKIVRTTLEVKGVRSPYANVNLPGTIQFEDFDRGGEGLSFHDSDGEDQGDAKYRTDNQGVDIVKGNGGSAIGYTAEGEWLEYTVNVTKAGTYNCEATVSSGTTGAAFTVSLRDNGQSKQLCSISIPQTASSSWDTYTTVKTKLSQQLPEGKHILRVTITGPNGNLDKMAFTLEEGGEQPSTADPNFYVYLCFGQSNMEGNATPEDQDQTVDPRFQTLACVNFSSPKRTMGQWYTATPPIVRQGTGLGMADYFGRTMVENLPENVKVGVVDVAIGGTKIEGFMQEEVASYIASMNPNSEGWLINYFKAYDNDPYQRLVDMAKIAQKSGVIKGILLHQGESNNGQSDWPQKVKKIYDRLISDLGLNAKDVPLFVGETVSQAEGGACWLHNSVIAKVPSVIPNSYVISSADCPQKGDGLHFTAAGYRTMGYRYAQQALKLMGINIGGSEDPNDLYIAHRFESIPEIGNTPFAIVNEESGKAFYGISEQNLGFDTYEKAFSDANTGYLFTLEKSTAGNGYFLRLMQPNGEPYSIWGDPGYLNSQPVDGWCSFILGLNGQNGQDLKDGALWNIRHVAEKGFWLKNIGTGKYLHDASPAMYDDPFYFTFCTISIPNAIAAPTAFNRQPGGIYTLQGVKVGTTEQWSTLPRGIYIVDGKLRTKR